MQTIWKTVLTHPDQLIDVPKGAEMLCAREQGADICIWYRCDPAQPKEKRRIVIYGTGFDVAASDSYIGTAMVTGDVLGSLVYHVFERPMV